MHTSPAPMVPPNVTADMLTELIARYPASEARIQRGAALVRAGHVEWSPVVGMTLVVSATDPHRAYHVDACGCGCADHQARGVFCQHMAARALWMTALREETDQEQLLAITVDPADEAIPFALTPAALAFLGEPCEIEPRTAGGAIAVLPMSARARALSEELFGPEGAA